MSNPRNENVSVENGLCRACHAFCPVHVQIEGGRTVGLEPVKEHPVYHGYACAKGRASPAFPYGPERLLHSMKRWADGSYAPIASKQAIAEIAATVEDIIAKYGPRSVAVYTGTWGALNLPAWIFADAFTAAIHSPMSFGSMQIDSPGKPIAQALHGMWMAGHANLDQADAWLVIGTNPVMSMQGPPNPAYVLNRAKKRGARIYVIDPRRTEMARQADIFLQVPPGQDAVILAGMIHIIFRERLQDQAFLDVHARGVERLREAVRGITPEFVRDRTGIVVKDLEALARGYAASKAGVAFAGTGPNMAPHGTLTEYLRLALMTVCGHWRRAGDPVAAHPVLVHLPPPLAQAIDPAPAWDLGEKMNARDLSQTACGMPTSALAEEILLEGEDRVRVLIVNGGNPMLGWPDQKLTEKAMKKLDLLVCVDPVISATARYAHYVIAPKIHFETVNTTAVHEMLWGWIPVVHPAEPYAAYSPKLVEPPAGSDLIDDWRFFFDLARALGRQLKLKPVSYAFDPPEAEKRQVSLDMDTDLSGEQVWELLLQDSPVPLSEVKRHPAGKVFDRDDVRVLPGDPEHRGRLDVGNADMMEDLDRAFRNEAEKDAAGFEFRLVGRRLKDRYNSSWREQAVSIRKWSYNPLFMHDEDMRKHALREGDIVEISSRRGAIKGVVEMDNRLLPGVVSMSHAWGGNPEDNADPVKRGANTGQLTDTTRDYDPYSAIPRMGAIPVNIKIHQRREPQTTTVPDKIV